MPLLSSELAATGPRVIGATGGSGTRVTARIVRDAGTFIGTDLNNYEDALTFGEFSDTWINRYVAAGESGRGDLSAEMLADFGARLESHLSTRPADAVAWGWKEPRSIYLLPFFDEQMPTLRFLHFIRDGRDMAFSDNQQQLRKHGKTVFDGSWPAWRAPLRSIELWNRVNLQAADFGERVLGDRYLRVRFEDLCNQPADTVARIFTFFGLEGDAEEVAAKEVKPPGSLGRWRNEGKRIVADMERRAGESLSRFGYL